MSTSL